MATPPFRVQPHPQYLSRNRKVESDATASKHQLLMLFALMTGIIAVTYFLQSLWQPNGLVGLIYVPDSLVLFDTVQEFTAVRENAPYTMLSLIYGGFLYYSPYTLVIPNWLLMTIALYFLHATFAPMSRTGALYASLGLCLNPYLVIASSGPNKEIPLAALLAAFAYTLCHPRLVRTLKIFWCLVLLIPIYILRDAAAGAALGILTLWFFGQLTSPFRTAALSLLAGVMFITVSGFLFEETEVFKLDYRETAATFARETGSQATQYALDYQTNPGVSAILYLYRIAANAFSLILRPSILSSKGVFSVIGLAYVGYGWLLALGLLGVYVLSTLRMSALQANVSSKWVLNTTSAFFLLTCVGYYVQPRYLMAISPLGFGCFGLLAGKDRRRIFWLLLFAALAGLGMQLALGQQLPVQDDYFDFKPPYLSDL